MDIFHTADPMRKSVTIRKEAPHAMYIPKDLADDGFTGETDMLANAATATIIKPGATLEEVERSLSIILEDVRLRRSESERRKNETG